MHYKKFTSLCLVSLSFALPTLSDFHQTSLDLYTNGKLSDGGRFAVQVKRVDDLVNNANSAVLAERLTDVIIQFDVDLSGKALVNGVPIPIGLSNVKIEAGTVAVSSAEGAKVNQQVLADAFDVGFVGMKVEVIAEQVVIDSASITRLTLIETITEVNGRMVEQSVAMQQVFEIKNGEVERMPACHATDLGIQSIKSDAQEVLIDAFNWLHEAPAPLRFAVSILVGSVFGLIAVIIATILVSVYQFVFGIRKAPQMEDEESLIIKKISFKETEAGFVVEREVLPTYYTEGYSAVETEVEN